MRPVYRIYFRRRAGQTWPAQNVLLVEGKNELERILARKTPIAVAWERAKLHKCSGCGRRGAWTDGWAWRGEWRELESGKDVEASCSNDCREALPAREGERGRLHWISYEPLRARERAKRREVGMSESDRASLTRARRTVPLPAKPKDGKRRCGWCTKEITGPYAHLRSWHPDCKKEWLLHHDRDAQARFLAKRDGYDCWDCRQGGRWWRVRLVEMQYTWEAWPLCLPPKRLDWDARAVDTGRKIDGVIVGLYTEIQWRPHCGELEVDHEIPLWSIWHLPDDERRRFYGPENLRLRCKRCHKAKSRREAAERAQLKAKGPVALDDA